MRTAHLTYQNKNTLLLRRHVLVKAVSKNSKCGRTEADTGGGKDITRRVRVGLKTSAGLHALSCPVNLEPNNIIDVRLATEIQGENSFLCSSEFM